LVQENASAAQAALEDDGRQRYQHNSPHPPAPITQKDNHDQSDRQQPHQGAQQPMPMLDE
jgi:hypothetical protein